MRQVVHVSSALRAFLRSAQLEKQISRWEVVLAWPRVVGKDLAEQAHALELRGSILWVAVPSSSWRQHISYLKPQILNALKREFPEVPVTDIYCIASRSRPGDA